MNLRRETQKYAGPCRLYRVIGDGVEDGKRAWTHRQSAKQFAATPTGFRLYVDDRDRTRFIKYEVATACASI
jgi:hypothetical protein